jgi:hypothetical protein
MKWKLEDEVGKSKLEIGSQINIALPKVMQWLRFPDTCLPSVRLLVYLPSFLLPFPTAVLQTSLSCSG